jgi:hypothetical protein
VGLRRRGSGPRGVEALTCTNDRTAPAPYPVALSGKSAPTHTPTMIQRDEPALRLPSSGHSGDTDALIGAGGIGLTYRK